MLENRFVSKLHFQRGMLNGSDRLLTQSLIIPMCPVSSQDILQFGNTMFYSLLSGESIGESVLKARKHAYDTNTFGAVLYAIYGNPFGKISSQNVATMPEPFRVIEVWQYEYGLIPRIARKGIGPKDFDARVQGKPTRIFLETTRRFLPKFFSDVDRAIFERDKDKLYEACLVFGEKMFGRKAYRSFMEQLLDFDYIIFKTEHLDIPWHMLLLDDRSIGVQKPLSVMYNYSGESPFLDLSKFKERFRNLRPAILVFVPPNTGLIDFDSLGSQILATIDSTKTKLELYECYRRFCRFSLEIRGKYSLALLYLVGHSVSIDEDEGIELTCCYPPQESYPERTCSPTEFQCLKECQYYLNECTLEQVRSRITDQNSCHHDYSVKKAPCNRMAMKKNNDASNKDTEVLARDCIAILSSKLFDFSVFSNAFMMVNCCQKGSSHGNEE